jgi:transcription elongation GreA/GreB family factor
MPSDRDAFKKALRGRMIELEEAELASAMSHYQAFLSESQLDESEVYDNSELSNVGESLEMAQAFDHPVQSHAAKIAAIEATDFSPTDVVRPGAGVIFSDRRFVVAVSTARFDCEGHQYMGISAQSPIYRAMEGLRAGDSFTLNGRDMEIQEVI